MTAPATAEDVLAELLVMFNQDKIRFSENANLPARQIKARMEKALKAPPINAYRVEVAWKTKRENVLLGMTERAADEGAAYRQAVAKHVKPFKARRLLWVKIEPVVPA